MARIIEARALLTAEDQASQKIVAIAKRIGDVAKAQATYAKSGAQQFSSLSKQVDATQAKLNALTGYRKLAKDLDAASIAHRRAQQEAARIKSALDAAGGAGGRLAREYDRAARAVENTKTAFMAQGRATRQARADLEAMGVPVKRLAEMQQRLVAQVDRATAAFQRQAAVAKVPAGSRASAGAVHMPATHSVAASPSGGTAIVPVGMKGLAPLAVAYGASRVHGAVIEQHHDFQQAYLYKQALLGLDKSAQAPFIAQSEKIGKDTKFSNADIIRAQTDIGSKLPKEMQKPSAITAITEHVKNYALAMKVTMEEGAEAVVNYMKSWNYDLSSAEAAENSARRASNLLVEFAKTTGAKHHDILGSTKFGGAPSRVGGMSEELSRALEAQLIRVGYEGAMAGTFSRAVATKLAVPSQQGRAAIAGMGIEYGDYRRPGAETATADAFSKMLKQKYGRGLDAQQQASIQTILDDPEIVGDSAAFAEKTADVLNKTFVRKTKSGKVDAKQAESLRKTTDQFYSLISGGTDVPRLLMDILNRPGGLTAPMARYLFGQEHGGRAIGLDEKNIRRDEKAFRETPDNRASVVADKMQEGSQGEWNKMIGSVQTFGVALGEATDATRAWTYKGIGSLFDYLTDAVKGKNVDPKVGAKMTVLPEGAPYRFDTWHSDAVGMYERSMRAQRERMRDPEAARGRAFSGIGDVSQLKATVSGPIDVTGKLDPVEIKGQATVSITVKAQEGSQVVGMSTSSSGHVKAEGTALVGRFGRN